MPQNKQKRELNLSGGTPIFGMPGYRTRDDRSGLDPLETRAEAAHMEGVFYRNLFTLQLRTRNPFYLILMFLFGAIPFSALTFLIFSVLFSESSSNWVSLIFPMLFFIVTGALTINFILSILQITGLISSAKPLQFVQKNIKAQEKKLPKRRKDFK